MKSAERRDELLRMVRSNGYVSAPEASRALNVNGSTIRRDLARLHELGLVERRHGVAVKTREEAEVPYDVKLGRLVQEKRAIGELTASLIPDGCAVVLDSGSTVLMVARALASRRDLTVITPDIRIAAELISRPEIRLIMLGGEGIPSTTTVISQDAVESMRRYHPDIAVMATDAADPECASNLSGTVVPLKREMMRAAQTSILAIDSSKLGQRRLVKVAPMQEFDQLITDTGLDDMALDRYPVLVRRAPPTSEGVGQE